MSSLVQVSRPWHKPSCQNLGIEQQRQQQQQQQREKEQEQEQQQHQEEEEEKKNKKNKKNNKKKENRAKVTCWCSTTKCPPHLVKNNGNVIQNAHSSAWPVCKTQVI